ncbi:hypothetical protein JYP52_01460 [Nitratireductor aquibiodomus]|uniref:hypothetical protein n=1 Tax=Nitratireductor TaxID=245876 RepID=UPI0019D32A59|nr:MULTISPECIES: hypothetical protein [Nitratireductor]MBN7759790.1 hypothetical protein [Nitratireductor aquibiodomus]MCV0350183.1 hypothetical protein [Nitratireductor sp.]MDV2968719.1 hypothetical protein [Nitratireductor aquimarinus]
MRPDHHTILAAVNQAKGFRPAERLLRSMGYTISERSIRRTMAGLPDTDEPFSVDNGPELDIEELIRRRAKVFEKQNARRKHDKLIPVRVNMDGPIGLGFMGDPHVDSDGCNIELLMRHCEIFDGRNEGMFAACLGDMWNNWSGRLARLWADQTTDGVEARALVKYFLERIYWMFVVYGNHDLWSGQSRILDEMLAGNAGAVRDWRARVGLRFPNGRTCKIYASHRFPGRSMYLKNMGAVKKAVFDGQHDIYVSGDLHVAGYTLGAHPGADRAYHAVQVGTYKEIDSFGDEINAEDHNLYTCPVALIDPYAKSPLNFIRWEFDPEQAVDRLAWMRSRWARNLSCED